MFRKQAISEKKRKKDPIKWRGHEVTRVEAFSDAVLAFAVTLLIVALEVPESYDELMASFGMFIPFALCFLILFVIWQSQNIFFRRYGLRDGYTVRLNGLLLFLTLFFAYPLKFLITAWLGPGHHHFKLETIDQLRNLFMIYGGGFAAIYIVFAMMYHNAYRKRDFLELTQEEVCCRWWHCNRDHCRFPAATGMDRVCWYRARRCDP
jgi:uncharacterized membrane protein